MLVTSAHRPLARQIVLRLLEDGGEVRAHGHGDLTALRAAGAFVAHGTPDDEGHLEAALADVHTVIHVGAGVLSEDPEADVHHVEVLTAAATGAGVARLILLSVPDPGADGPGTVTLQGVKRTAESIVASATVPSIVVRTSLVDTPTLRDAIVTGGLRSSVEVAPVDPRDLVELVVAFDAARSRLRTGHLVASADGPLTLAFDDWAAGVRDRGGLVGRRLPSEGALDTLRHALDGRWTTTDDDVLDGWAFAGLTPTPPVGHVAGGT
ncbi:MAG: NAD(P)H-binding protein [Nitriliruptoraceae bacterium]